MDLLLCRLGRRKPNRSDATAKMPTTKLRVLPTRTADGGVVAHAEHLDVSDGPAVLINTLLFACAPDKETSATGDV